MSEASSERIEVERIGHVSRIWLNCPDKRNAQDMAMLDALDAALTAAERDAEVHAVILAGRGAHFSAGHDYKERQRGLDGYVMESHYAFEQRYYLDYCLHIWDLRKPIVAQVQGACVAGGFMLANMCDLIVASESAYFLDPVAQTMATAATEILCHPWLMGLRRAKEFLFLGERMSAAEAYRIGLVNRVVEEEGLADATLAIAERIASAAPFTMSLLKRSLNRTADTQGFRASVQAHFDAHMLGHNSRAFREVAEAGLSAAITKNKAL